MALFPGDMNIGWGCGREIGHSSKPGCQCSNCQLEQDESQLTDPLLAVSELEQRVIALEERLRCVSIVVCQLQAVLNRAIVAGAEKD